MIDVIEDALIELSKRRMEPKEQMTVGEDKDIGTEYSQYDKMLREFSEAKGVTIEESGGSGKLDRKFYFLSEALPG